MARYRLTLSDDGNRVSVAFEGRNDQNSRASRIAYLLLAMTPQLAELAANYHGEVVHVLGCDCERCKMMNEVVGVTVLDIQRH